MEVTVKLFIVDKYLTIFAICQLFSAIVLVYLLTQRTLTILCLNV